MTSEEHLDSALSRIRTERSTFLTRLEGLSQEQFDFKPAKDSWSIGETVHHVGLTEKLLQENVQELLQTGGKGQGVTRQISFEALPMGPRMIPPFLMRFAPFQIPFMMMNTVVPPAVRSLIMTNPLLKIRTAPIVEPRAGIPRSELIKFLRQLRDSTVRLLEPVRTWDLARFCWEHPMMGTRDIYETLELLADHDRRHGVQVERIRNSPGFPAQ